MNNNHICCIDVLSAYLDSGAEKQGVSFDDWEEKQTVCTYCSDKKGKPLCPGAIQRVICK